jgi:uncharacterized protein YneF (UPF0154 family)
MFKIGEFGESILLFILIAVVTIMLVFCIGGAFCYAVNALDDNPRLDYSE